MPTLKDMEQTLVNADIPGVSPETVALIMAELRRAMPGEKIYVCPPSQSKREAIEKAVKTLPTAVVVERFGVTRQYVHKVTRHGVKRKP